MSDEITELNLTIEIFVKQIEPFIKEYGEAGITKFKAAKRKYYMGLLYDSTATHHDSLLKHMIKPENINSYRLKYVIESYISDKKEGLPIDPEVESFCLDRLIETANDINSKQSLGIKDKPGPKQDVVVNFQMICYLHYLLKTGTKPTEAKKLAADNFHSNLKTVNRLSKEIQIPDVSAETLFTLANNPIPNFFSMAD